MLTASEKRWLKDRKLSPTPFCGWCMKYALCCNPQFNRCPIKDSDWQDAVEFSERVAAKLAKHIHNKPLVCETNWDCPYWPQGKCAWCYLKAARIEVEEEMDGR